MITLADMLRDLYGLTERQTDVLCYIVAYYAQQRMAPTFAELQKRFGVAPQAIESIVGLLRKKGALPPMEGNHARNSSRRLLPTFVFIPVEKLCA